MAAALVYDCDLPHLGAKLEKNDVFELPEGAFVVDVKVAALVLEYEVDDFLHEAEGASSAVAAWLCFSLVERFETFFLFVTSGILEVKN